MSHYFYPVISFIMDGIDRDTEHEVVEAQGLVAYLRLQNSTENKTIYYSAIWRYIFMRGVEILLEEKHND